jgi:hypothetical protein
MKASTRRWIEAAKLLATEPVAVVRCPEHNDGVLRVHDEALPDGGGIEHYLICDACGAYNVILLRRTQNSK